MVVKQYLSQIKKSGICVISQTDNGFKKINDSCNKTWKYKFLNKGYDIYIVDYSQSKKGFVDILLDERFKDYEYVITMFDDLYFQYLNIPSMTSLYYNCTNLSIDYIRFDGRPPNFSHEKIIIDNLEFYKIKRLRKYSLSTVLACFNKKMLVKIREKGVNTAWGIETFIDANNLNAYAPNMRNAKYRNVIVKGKIDLIQLHLINANTISLIHSMKKIIYRSVKSLFN